KRCGDASVPCGTLHLRSDRGTCRHAPSDAADAGVYVGSLQDLKGRVTGHQRRSKVLLFKDSLALHFRKCRLPGETHRIQMRRNKGECWRGQDERLENACLASGNLL